MYGYGYANGLGHCGFSIETLNGQEVMNANANALNIRPTHSGPMAVQVASEAATKQAIDQLDTVAHVTGCTLHS